MLLIGPIRFRGKYGYLSPSGDWAIDPKFEELGPFSDGLASFAVGDKVGFIDEQGKEAISPSFDILERVGCWIHQFGDGLAGVRLDGRSCYIDRSGKVRLSFEGSVVLWWFAKGQSLISSSLDGFRAIFPDGRMGPKIDVCDIPYFQPRDWNCIPCLIRLPDGEINAAATNWKGEVVFPPTYLELGEFQNVLATFKVEDGGLVGLVRIDETVVKQPTFLSVSYFNEGLAPAAIERKKVGFINELGEFVLAPDFQQAVPFSDGLACVTVKNGRPRNKGFINARGEMVIEPRFRRETSFVNGYAQVEFEDQFAVIDKTGKIIWQRPLEQAEGGIMV